MNQEITGEFSESETKVTFISGGHRHTIRPFFAVSKDTKKSLGSYTFQVGSHLWQIVCYPGGETNDVKEFVSLFLGYRGPENECSANWRLTLINQVDPTKNRSRAWLKGDKFNQFKTGRRWGWQKFIKRDDLLDPEGGFVKDDTVIFEASLDVYVKQTTSLLNEKKFDPVLYPIPASQLPSDISDFFQNGDLDITVASGPGALVDVEFNFADGEKRYAHSQILAARSPVFCSMFSRVFSEARLHNNGEKRFMSISVTDIDPLVFGEMLKFIYTGNVEWTKISLELMKRRATMCKKRSPVENAPEMEPVECAKRRRQGLFSQSVDSPSAEYASQTSQGTQRPHSASLHASGYDEQPIDLEEEEENLDSESYELKYAHVEDSLDEIPPSLGEEIAKENDNLNFALRFFEAADKYELNRLRLIAEHEILQILKDQINRINQKVQKGMKYFQYAFPKAPRFSESMQTQRSHHSTPNSFTKVYGVPSGLPVSRGTTPTSSLVATTRPKRRHQLSVHSDLLRYFRGDDVVSSQDLKQSDELWSNGFLDVLVVADRHNSVKLKKLCFSALTSDALSKRTKRILLSSDNLGTLDKSLLTEMLQYVSIREQKLVDEEIAIGELGGNIQGVPEAGKDNQDEKEAEDIDGCSEREISEMRETELKYELLERGYPSRGDRETLVKRLEEARNRRGHSGRLDDE